MIQPEVGHRLEQLPFAQQRARHVGDLHLLGHAPQVLPRVAQQHGILARQHAVVACRQLVLQRAGILVAALQLTRRLAYHFKPLAPRIGLGIVDALRVQLLVDPAVHAHRAQLLHVPGPGAERQPRQRVHGLLVYSLRANANRDRCRKRRRGVPWCLGASDQREDDKGRNSAHGTLGARVRGETPATDSC